VTTKEFAKSGCCCFLRGEGQKPKDKILVRNKGSQGIASIEGSLCYKKQFCLLIFIKKKKKNSLETLSDTTSYWQTKSGTPIS